MRRTLLLVLVAACGKEAPKAPRIATFEQAADEAVLLMREFGEILDGVEDVAGAEAAVPRLQALTERLKAVVSAVNRMPEVDPGPEVAGKVGDAYGSLSPATTAYTERVLGAPEIGDVLAEAYGDVQNQVKILRDMLGG
jgi:hypothetical protein